MEVKQHDKKSQGVKRHRQKENKPTACVNATKFSIVSEALHLVGFQVCEQPDNGESLLQWSDSGVVLDHLTDLKTYQKFNHFPGMTQISRKDYLARNMSRLSNVIKDEYNFSPKTWHLPQEMSSLINYYKAMKKDKHRTCTFIVKPAKGSQGHGIYLFRDPERLHLPQTNNTQTGSNPVQPPNFNGPDAYIAQEYVEKPLLLDGFKFDLRIYVLVTSCDPLRIFLYSEGLVRMGTVPYQRPTDDNVSQLFMHLTNYSINIKGDGYERTNSDTTGSKRSLRYLTDFLRKSGHDVQVLWKNITDLIIKTLLVAQPHLVHCYRMARPGQLPSQDSVCFEILGFDILLDSKLKPWLLEVNRAPSFGTGESLDRAVKLQLLKDAFTLIKVRPSDKQRTLKNEKMASQRRLYFSNAATSSVSPSPVPPIGNGHNLQVGRQPLISSPRRSSSYPANLCSVAATSTTGVNLGNTAKNRPAASKVTKEEQKKKKLVLRKEKLMEVLSQIRRDNKREDYENRHLGKFWRIFPPEDKVVALKHYTSLLSTSFLTLLQGGRGSQLEKEIQATYIEKPSEHDVLDELAEIEEELAAPVTSSASPSISGNQTVPHITTTLTKTPSAIKTKEADVPPYRRQPKPLSSMPEAVKPSSDESDSCSDSSTDDDNIGMNEDDPKDKPAWRPPGSVLSEVRSPKPHPNPHLYSGRLSSKSLDQPYSEEPTARTPRLFSAKGSETRTSISIGRNIKSGKHMPQLKNSDNSLARARPGYTKDHALRSSTSVNSNRSKSETPNQMKRSNNETPKSQRNFEKNTEILDNRLAYFKSVGLGGVGCASDVEGGKDRGSGPTISEKEYEKLMGITVEQFSTLSIRCPGKTEAGTQHILVEIKDQYNWMNYYRSRVASYWLVKLDAKKRQKVIEIVRSNVAAVMERVWQIKVNTAAQTEADSSTGYCRSGISVPVLNVCRLPRILSRLFARLLSSGGQELWRTFCLTTTPHLDRSLSIGVNGVNIRRLGPDFSLSLDGSRDYWRESLANCQILEQLAKKGVLTASEKDACRIVIDLCRDCVLVVYWFASSSSSQLETNQRPQSRLISTSRSPEAADGTRVPNLHQKILKI